MPAPHTWRFSEHEHQLARAKALLEARTTLCDLLIGRSARLHASEELAIALRMEAIHASPLAVTLVLCRAAHWEWIAGISERGQVAWGQRLNRCGSPEDSP